MTPFQDFSVAQVFETYPENIRSKLLSLRELIFQVAISTKGVGELHETLKWGEPAYLTLKSKAGSTLRIAWKNSNPRQYGMYFNCQTNLVETFRLIFPHQFKFEGNRAILFDETDIISSDSLTSCIASTLTYHLNKETFGR